MLCIYLFRKGSKETVEETGKTLLAKRTEAAKGVAMQGLCWRNHKTRNGSKGRMGVCQGTKLKQALICWVLIDGTFCVWEI